MRIQRSGKALTVAACATTLLVVAGCGSNGSNSGEAANQVDHGSKPAAMTGLVGSGCAAYAKQVPKGPGSVGGMAADPVAVAASNNPLLTTLVKAVSGKLNPKVNLVNALDNGQYTVFAPIDSAFAKLPATTVAALSKPANAAMLTSILSYHVVPGQLSPAMIDGTHKTVEGQNVTVSGSGDHMRVNGASVICGGVKTANATVYLIGSVLSVPKTSVSSDLVGPGCAAYAKQEPTGPASVAGMAADPVAVAASNNPLLTTLVKAVSGKLNPKVNLVNTLDNGQYTVFAPIDSAFAKLPASTIAMLSQPQNASKLAAILAYHVVAGQLSPAMIVGTHKTLEGSTLKVTGSGMSLKVNGAPVVCGGVKTANATVYLIGSVLSPPSH